MSMIRSGGTGPSVMAAPGRPMFAAPLGAASHASDDFGSIAGLTGWWDAGVADGILGLSGVPMTIFGGPVGSVADKSGAGAGLAVWHAASGGTMAPVATGHLSGLLGGIGLNTVLPPALPAAGQQLPLMDPDQGLISRATTVGSNTAWTLLLVWSRPNWKQNATAASILVSIAGTPVLAADNDGGTRLVLFPGASQIVLTNALTRRHTHAVTLRNTPGVGVDVWLDQIQVATAAPNPLAASLSAPVLFLHNGTSGGGAECWFHEAATWSRALTSADIAVVLAYQQRWTLGPRRGIQILVIGQSNAGNALNDGAWHLLAQGVAWHLGALGFGVVGSYGSPPAATCIHGEGLYGLPSLGFTGSFLDNPNDGSDPSTWSLGADGLAVQTWVQSRTPAADAADIAVVLWPWSEDDSCRQYSEKSTYAAAARHFLALERGMLRRNPGSLPQVWWSAIPFAYNNNDPGTQMHREVVADMAADPALNVTVVLPQTADSLPRGTGGPALTYDPATGIWSGGDPLHRDIVDNRRFGRLAAPLVARAILASGGGDSIAGIPPGVPALGGPAVIHAYRQSSANVIVTVRHDCGTDLVVPGTQAASGAGWAIMDGGTVASPGAIVTATSCVRLNATQLRITLTRDLVNASIACRLFYPYGTTTIGRGNVVSDNLASVTPPAGWNITDDLGSSWALNMPLHVPMTSASGIVLSDTP